MSSGRKHFHSACAWIAAASLVACSVRTYQPVLHAPDEMPRAHAKSPALKVHMKSGELYVLASWQAAPDGSSVTGSGTLYSVERLAGATGHVSIRTDEVALFETNTPQGVTPAGAVILSIWATIAGTVTVACVADPKSCFGSCPTFYADGDDPSGRPVAEGFSASIARVLEARDVDAIGPGPARGGRFGLTMRNEAFETHAVRRVRLLAAARAAEGRVLAGSDGLFYPASGPRAPIECRAAEGGCLPAVVLADAVERSSPADPSDLASRELVELDFAPARGRVGLVVAARQTLLSTHLFYRTMAFFGSRAGEFLASLERGGTAAATRAMGLARVLGAIDAEVSEDGENWRAIGSFDEAGPIAGDVRVLPFEARGGPLRVRLRQSKGHWRLDQVSLVGLGDPVLPSVLEPIAVERGPRADARALELLRGGERHLVTAPGDEYRIVFDLPSSPHGLQLFLESEGYYYEWMRQEWLADEDPEMASLVLTDPAQALRRMAGPFKKQEAGMDAVFWSSRFRR
ncbi:MAG TPA: hypothetical protein VIJ10_00010 [Vicinamibacteria bacterium]